MAMQGLRAEAAFIDGIEAPLNATLREASRSSLQGRVLVAVQAAVYRCIQPIDDRTAHENSMLHSFNF